LYLECSGRGTVLHSHSLIQKRLFTWHSEIGSFEGQSAVFVGELNNVKEVTCVNTFEGSDEHNNINFDLVFNLNLSHQ